jgi:hypothetical protein
MLCTVSEQDTAAIRLREEIAWREIDGEIVLLDLTGSAYYTVSRSGLVLWPAVVEGSTAAELTDRLAQSFSLDRETAARDVGEFLQALANEGLLEPRG